jgi:small subunit ribosomal protein S1
MPVHIEPTEKQMESEFSKLYEETSKTKTLKEGEIIKGKIVRIGRDFVTVDIGFKSEGRIPIEEFRTPGVTELSAQVGETIDVLIDVIENEHGEMILSKERADSMRTWEKLAEVSEGDAVVEGTIISKVKGGFSVDIGVRAFLPASQVDLRPPRNLDKYVGNKYEFKILKINKRRGNVVLSRKILLEKEREALKETTLKNLSEGQIFDGVVKNVTDYGVFVDLGGIDGLLHITDMTWGRINHPSEMFSMGDDIRVVVLKFDAENNKVSLGLKQLQPDPWQEVEGKYPVGSRVSGKVVNMADYGAFIELEGGVEGLIHISEMSWSKKIKHPSKVVSVGDNVEAIVLDVDMDNRRISLGLKQIQPNPWDELEDKYPIGSKVKGRIRNIADFGVFVDVGTELDGMIHISDMTWVQNFGHPSEEYNKGDEVEAVVLQVDPENERFSLGLKQLMDDAWDIINVKYAEGSDGSGEVVKITSAGAVVKLEEGVEGLVPKGAYPESLKVGDEVSFKVDKHLPRERKFILKMEGAPEATEEATEEAPEETEEKPAEETPEE